MSVGVRVGTKYFPLGSSSFLKAWFSTVFVRAEAEDWGARFPVLMREFYSGELSSSSASKALEELALMKQELTKFKPDAVVWDFENRASRPPWGADISSDITSLGNYFVTSEGKDLFKVLRTAFEEAARAKKPAVIE